MKNFFVTGTDTEVGKTYVSCLIIRALRAAGVDAVGFKPVACGDRQDARLLRQAGIESMSLESINPVYLKNATCPYVAAQLENAPVDMELIMRSYSHLEERHECVLVEGVGGWQVPIGPGVNVSDLAVRLDLPVLLVIGNKLGAINHALLTIQAIQACGLTCMGLVFNNMQDTWDTACVTNRNMIQELTDLPVLAELIHGQDYLDAEFFLEALR